MKTEIFATFGPACETERTIGEMIQSGMTGMRLNLSHSTLRESEKYIRVYESAAIKSGVKPQILIDMQGPELRVERFETPLFMKEGERVAVPIPKVIFSVLEVGDELLFDDGKILAKVCELTATGVYLEVIRGGVLSGGKSVKVVGKNITMPPLTVHDIENIKCAKEYGVTALMQPFVLNGEDLKYVREILKENGLEHIQIFAKIENRLGVENLDSILPEADVIIIARGDLGNDMPLWELPRIQKQIEEACKKANKPYVVVTQMLASMEEHPVPTRAEVSDIFHAVLCGSYGIMVTGETAVGKYPVEAVKYLANTAAEAEAYLQKNK